MQNITKIDWRTKKISDQDLSIKLFKVPLLDFGLILIGEND